VVLGEIRASNDWDWNGARGEFERALAIDSADTDALTGMAMMVFAPEGQVKDAIGELNRVVDLDPLDPAPAADLGLLLYLDRQSDAAIAQLKKADSAEAREMLQRISQGARKAPESETAFDAACAYAKLGEKNRALDELDRAYDQHDQKLAYLKSWPDFDALRADPRFQALLKKMNLAR
jgi:serine/threonine-protein kinase